MRTKSLLVALSLATFALPAFAQAPQGGPRPIPANLRGTVVKLDGQTLAIKTREGQTVSVALAPNTSVRALAEKKLADIKDGDFIASTSMTGKDGKQHAVEVHMLPPQAPELQIPYDYKPGSLMTNAHVQGIAKSGSGNVITVTYKGKSTDIVVDSNTGITAAGMAYITVLKPGK